MSAIFPDHHSQQLTVSSTDGKDTNYGKILPEKLTSMYKVIMNIFIAS